MLQQMTDEAGHEGDTERDATCDADQR